MAKTRTDTAIAMLEKQYGKGVLVRLGAKGIPVAVDVIPTGSLTIDKATCIGGLPRGRVVEVFGSESSGKTTFTLQVIAQAQKGDGQAAFIDAEHALDLKYAKRLGVNTDDLLVSQPDYGEQALEIVEALTKTEEFDVIVIDSVAALVPKAELDGEMGDAQMGLQARLMSQAMRKLTAAVSRSRTILIFINQIRDKIGVMFGSPETTTGGRALKFYASMRIDIRRVSSIKSGDAIVGARTRAKIVKNKVGVPFREAQFDLMYGKGTSRGGELVDLGLEYGLLTKHGNWIADANQENIGQGRDQTVDYFEDNPKAADKLEEEIRYRMTEQVEGGPAPTEEEE